MNTTSAIRIVTYLDRSRLSCSITRRPDRAIYAVAAFIQRTKSCLHDYAPLGKSTSAALCI